MVAQGREQTSQGLRLQQGRDWLAVRPGCSAGAFRRILNVTSCIRRDFVWDGAVSQAFAELCHTTWIGLAPSPSPARGGSSWNRSVSTYNDLTPQMNKGRHAGTMEIQRVLTVCGLPAASALRDSDLTQSVESCTLASSETAHGPPVVHAGGHMETLSPRTLGTCSTGPAFCTSGAGPSPGTQAGVRDFVCHHGEGASSFRASV